MKKITISAIFFILCGLAILSCQSDKITVEEHNSSKSYRETKSTLMKAPISADFYMEFFKDNSPYQFVLWGNGSNDSLCCDVFMNGISEKGTPTIFHAEYGIAINVTDINTVNLKVQGVQSQMKIQEQAEGYVALKVYREGKYCGDAVVHDDFTKSSFVGLVGNLGNDNLKSTTSPLVLRRILRAIELMVALYELFNDSDKCCCGGTTYQEETMVCLHQGRQPVVMHTPQECFFTCKEKDQ